MKMRKLTALAVTAAFGGSSPSDRRLVLMLTADGGGASAPGVATALILGGIYHLSELAMGTNGEPATNETPMATNLP